MQSEKAILEKWKHFGELWDVSRPTGVELGALRRGGWVGEGLEGTHCHISKSDRTVNQQNPSSMNPKYTEKQHCSRLGTKEMLP